MPNAHPLPPWQLELDVLDEEWPNDVHVNDDAGHEREEQNLARAVSDAHSPADDNTSVRIYGTMLSQASSTGTLVIHDDGHTDTGAIALNGRPNQLVWAAAAMGGQNVGAGAGSQEAGPRDMFSPLKLETMFNPPVASGAHESKGALDRSIKDVHLSSCSYHAIREQPASSPLRTKYLFSKPNSRSLCRISAIRGKPCHIFHKSRLAL